MAEHGHHPSGLLLQPATLFMLAGSLVVAALLAIAGHPETVAALAGAVVVIAGFGGLHLLLSQPGHGHDHH